MNGSQFHIVKCSNRLKIIATPCHDLNRCAKRKGCLLQTTSDYVICKQTVIFKLSHHNSIIFPPLISHIFYRNGPKLDAAASQHQLPNRFRNQFQ